MKKVLMISSIGLFVVMVLSAFAPATPPAKVEDAPILIKELPEVLNALIVIFGSSGLGVLLANIAKNIPFMKWMDGKTDKVVAVVVTCIFGYAVYLKLFNVELLNQLMPWIEDNLAKYVEYASVVFGWIFAILGMKPIHDALAGKLIIGKSFSAVKK